MKKRRINRTHLLIVIASVLSLCLVIALIFRKSMKKEETVTDKPVSSETVTKKKMTAVKKETDKKEEKKEETEETEQKEETSESEEQTEQQITDNNEQSNEEATATQNNDVVDNYTDILSVANKKHALPYDYVPGDLRTVNVDRSANWQMRDEAATALENMFTAAGNDGITLVACSGYRSAVYQDQLYSGYVQSYGTATADSISSRPGYSDHQTGLAMDIGDHDQATVFTTDMKNTPEGQWLYTHAHEYGFVLRYPEGKEYITGYSFEPWHYRYVGIAVAEAMYAISPDETLEEYLGVSGGDYE